MWTDPTTNASFAWYILIRHWWRGLTIMMLVVCSAEKDVETSLVSFISFVCFLSAISCMDSNNLNIVDARRTIPTIDNAQYNSPMYLVIEKGSVRMQLLTTQWYIEYNNGIFMLLPATNLDFMKFAPVVCYGHINTWLKAFRIRRKTVLWQAALSISYNKRGFQQIVI